MTAAVLAPEEVAASRPVARGGRWKIAASAAVSGVAALAVGLWGLNATSLGRDEGATLAVSTRSAADIVRTAHNIDGVHAFYYLIMHVIESFAGTGEQAVRAPSAVAAGVAAALLTVLGARLMSWHAGLVAGVLYAGAPMVSLYAQDARSYAMVSALAIGVTIALVSAVRRPSPGRWVLYGVLLTLLVVLHAFTILIVGAHAVTMLWYRLGTGNRTVWRRWLITVACCAPLVGGMLLAVSTQARSINWITRPTWTVVGTLITNFCGTALLIAPMLILAALAFRRRATTGTDGTPTAWVVALPWLLVPPTALLLISLIHPEYVFRYVLYSLPALILLVAAGLQRIHVVVRVVIVIALLAAVVPAQRQQRDPAIAANDLRSAAQYLTAMEQPGDAIMYLAPWQRDLAHAYYTPYARLYDLGLDSSPTRSASLSGIDVSDNELFTRLAEAKRVWVVGYHVPHATSVADSVDHRWQLIRDTPLRWVLTMRFQGVTISLFAVRPPKP